MKWNVINSNAASSVIWSLASVSLPTASRWGTGPCHLAWNLQEGRRLPGRDDQEKMGLGRLPNASIWGGDANGIVRIVVCSHLARSVPLHLSLVLLPGLSVKMKDHE